MNKKVTWQRKIEEYFPLSNVRPKWKRPNVRFRNEISLGHLMSQLKNSKNGTLAGIISLFGVLICDISQRLKLRMESFRYPRVKWFFPTNVLEKKKISAMLSSFILHRFCKCNTENLVKKAGPRLPDFCCPLLATTGLQCGFCTTNNGATFVDPFKFFGSV